MSSRQSLPPISAFGNVALLMGGWSAEREISLKSGAAVLAALKSQQVVVEAIDVDKNIYTTLSNSRYDRVFNILHGRGGEDGVLQAQLELLDIPYTGSGVLGCAIAMDKLRCKWLWQGLGLPTPPSMLLASSQDCEYAVQQLGLPLAIKPINEGSSIGISRVESANEVLPAWQLAQQYGAVMAEKWISGSEYTVAVLEAKALPSIRLETSRNFYDYDAKYIGNQTAYHCPSGLDEVIEEQLQQLSLQAFHAVGGYGWGRVDIMLDESNQPWLIEVNTVPGMTDHSLVPMAAKSVGIDFEELVLRILNTSLINREENNYGA